MTQNGQLDTSLVGRLLSQLFVDPVDALGVLAQTKVCEFYPGHKGGFMKKAVPPSVVLGDWTFTAMGRQTQARHTVGGIVLATETLGPDAAARLAVRCLKDLLDDVPVAVSDACVAHLEATAEVRGIF